MNLEDRIVLGLFAVICVGISAAGFALGGSHPALNFTALSFGIVCGALAVEDA